MKKLPFLLCSLLFCLALATDAAAQGYRQPPKNVMDVLNAPPTPSVSISPTNDYMLLAEGVRYPPISELAQPMLRLGGLRINPNTTGQHRQPYFVKMTLKRIEGGAETPVALPAGFQAGFPQWSADGKYFAFTNTTANGIELWIGEAATAKARRLPKIQVNGILGGFQWMPDQKTLLVNTVPVNRGAAPSQTDAPSEPNVQETSGRAGAVQTFQDLLRSPADERLFEYYLTSQLAVVDLNGRARTIGQPAIFDMASPSPDGQNILTSRIQRPFSYLYPFSRFPKEVEVWNTQGRMIYKVASVPLQDALPIEGVSVGRRAYGWIPTEAATLVWAEALDEGNPRNKVTPRDKLMLLPAPFAAQPVEIVKTEHRYQGRQFGEQAGMMMVFDYNRETRRRRIFMLDYRNPSAQPKMISDLNISDRYNNPGDPVTKLLPNGRSVILQNGDFIFLEGEGASAQGDRPFLDRMNLKTMAKERLWQSDAQAYEFFVELLDESGKRFITRRETPLAPPNFILRDANGQTSQLTNFPDPTPQLRGIKKQLVKYKRADGVDLSFTLYLPPNYKEGTRLPTVIWAYPLEFSDQSVAGQVSGSTQRFTSIGGTSHLFFLLNGYAVLDDATMPVIGDRETVNDTFIKQIVDSARAAIDKAVEMGVTDRDHVGVGGHSYGAFMTANLLAHSDLFRAGIARSGAYNRTLTPFGFQGESRNFWEATKLYTEISPFFYANKINEPILLIHGEADNNQGTFPIQSERMFAAIRGNGGTARLVMLPLESHGYAARESTEHTLYEMVNWFDKHVKNAPPRANRQTAKQ